ncbi:MULTISPECIES: hypothetical protein [Bradyrhizobium]|uniref:Uncharacterized protein n=2 Tax=Bradyrhizobium TaxID=374 RepID=A0ABY0QF98_9BRAD|nr:MULTISPECIES: hypothetical protein [Bradyrhizobium]SDK14922.1 hypothetical protein SAMN05444163_7362 [Bradyrhizobium ottawaense]SEE50487.1 hypothetical protein SAMN05444171_7769 [Bradyrhizobium lablabi]
MATRTPKSPETKPTTQAAELPASPMPTLTAEALASLLAEVASQKAEIAKLYAELTSKPEKPAANGKSEVSTLNDAKVLKVLKKQGFKDVRPRENVLTFQKWIEAGRRPIEGSHALKINNLRLFHISQTRPLEKADQAKMKEQKAAHEARKNSKVVPINAGAPQ